MKKNRKGSLLYEQQKETKKYFLSKNQSNFTSTVKVENKFKTLEQVARGISEISCMQPTYIL